MSDVELFNLLLGCSIGYILGILIALYSDNA